MSINELWVKQSLLAGGTTNITATSAYDLVNLETAEALIAGTSHKKEAAEAATVANINLATGGLLVVDGYQTLEGDRILVKAQTNAAENGIYVAGSGAWVRTDDADENGEIVAGMSVYVHHDGEHPGNGHIYTMVSEDPIVIGVDPIAFVIAAGVTGHADDVAVDSTGWAQLVGPTVEAALTSADTKIDTLITDVSANHTQVLGQLGLAGGDSDFGTFTGSTLSDSSDAKALFQELETKVEANAAEYAASKVVLASQAVATGVWTTLTHGLNDAELSSVSFFDEANNLQNVNASVIWRPKTGDTNSVEVYQASGALKTLKVVARV